MTVAASSIQSIPLAALHLSDSDSQKERRRRYEKAAIDELVESFLTVGQLQPIVVRPFNGSNEVATFEIVAGERRYIAAKKAGLEEIQANVLDLNDQQVLEVQLIENLQREGLHELAEAEGYEALIHKHRYTVDDLVAKVGKSKGYVYARLKLLALGKESRKAFYDGKLNASIALLLARIPVEKLQAEALKVVLRGEWEDRGPMSVRDAQDHIQRHYMLRLADAPFPTDVADLVAAAGPCGLCPKRTGNQPELFADVRGADVCTDPACFELKRQAWSTLRIERARESGQTVIAGKEAKQLAPHGLHSIKGHVQLSDVCYEDSKQRTYRQLIGKDVTPVLLQDPNTGDMIEIVPTAEATAALKNKGVKARAAGSPSNSSDNLQRKKAQAENKFRRALFIAIRPKLPAKLGRDELEAVALRLFARIEHETGRQLLEVLGWEAKKRHSYGGVDTDGAVKLRVPKLSDAELARFIQECVMAPDLRAYAYSLDKPTALLDVAKLLRINVDKIRKESAPATKKRSGK